MPPTKINIEDLKRMVIEGKAPSEIARAFGVSKSAVSQRLKSLNIAISKDVTLHHAGQIVKKKINALEQLQKINDHANEILDLLMKWNRGDEGALQILESQVRKVKVRGTEEEITEYRFKDPRELALRAMGEIRGQLKLQLEIFQTLYDMTAVAEFQKEVLNAIGQVDKETRGRIISELQARRAIRSTLEWS